MSYDRMDWHYGADDFPEELNEKCGGTHIGMFLAWTISNNLIGEVHTKESISKVKSRQITGTDFLQEECDEKFWEEDLNHEGNEFAKFYYESNMYFEDYAAILVDDDQSIYHVEDNWQNFDKLSKQLDKQFKNWKHPKKRWWQVW